MSCDFCRELAGSPTNAFARIYGPSANRVLFRSDTFVVIPSLGQIVEGYLLVLPIEHSKALADLPTRFLDELASIVELVGNILAEQYGSYILFEHGARSEMAGGCGICHAHLHATPLAGITDPIDTLRATFPYTQSENLTDIKELSASLDSYLFYRDTAAKLYLFDTGPLPSQYMRRLIADALHESNWNWRIAEREERLIATMERLSGRFEATQKHAQQSKIANVAR